MKVILLQDVANLGRKLEVVTVSDGFALNKLIPKGQALAASPENVKKLTAKRDKMAEIQDTKQSKLKAIIASLGEKVIEIKTKVNDQGHLFEVLKVSQVIEALHKLGVELDGREFTLRESIKEAGQQQVTLVAGKVEFTLNIEILNVS